MSIWLRMREPKTTEHMIAIIEMFKCLDGINVNRIVAAALCWIKSSCFNFFFNKLNEWQAHRQRMRQYERLSYNGHQTCNLYGYGQYIKLHAPVQNGLDLTALVIFNSTKRIKKIAVLSQRKRINSLAGWSKNAIYTLMRVRS